MNIEFKGRLMEVVELVPGLVQKGKTMFYIQDRVNKKWYYSSPDRLAKLMEKYGSYESIVANTLSRDSKRELKAQSK